MGRFGLAWRVLFNSAFAQRVNELLDAPPRIESAQMTPPKPVTQKPVAPARSEAVTLLASLQREARLVDFLMEPIDNYSDAQVGAAVRDIHRNAAAMIQRQFGVSPVLDQAEGSKVSIAAGTSPGRVKRSAQSTGGNASGVVVHQGWQTTRCELPIWSGDPDAASVIAPAEVEA